MGLFQIALGGTLNSEMLNSNTSNQVFYWTWICARGGGRRIQRDVALRTV
jgi:hypothetical protein